MQKHHVLNTRKVLNFVFIHIFKYFIKFPTQVHAITTLTEDRTNIFCFLLPKKQVKVEDCFFMDHHFCSALSKANHFAGSWIVKALLVSLILLNRIAGSVAHHSLHSLITLQQRHATETSKYLDHKLFFIKFPRATQGQYLA